MNWSLVLNLKTVKTGTDLFCTHSFFALAGFVEKGLQQSVRASVFWRY